MELLHKGFTFSVHVTDDTNGGSLENSTLTLYSRVTDTTYTATTEVEQGNNEADYSYDAETTAEMLPGVYDMYLYNTENELLYYQHRFCRVIDAPATEQQSEGVLA